MVADLYVYEYKNLRLSVMSKELQESGCAKYRLHTSLNPKDPDYFEEILITDDETISGLVSMFEQALKDAARNYEPEPKKEYSRFADLDVV